MASPTVALLVIEPSTTADGTARGPSPATAGGSTDHYFSLAGSCLVSLDSGSTCVN
ncbi:MAG: hypothetical protein ACK559_09100 [bacterium]